jgi:hypothetical protein
MIFREDRDAKFYVVQGTVVDVQMLDNHGMQKVFYITEEKVLITSLNWTLQSFFVLSYCYSVLVQNL